MAITLTTNYEFKKNSLGHPVRDTFTAVNLDMIDAAIAAGVSPLTAAKIIVGNSEDVATGVVMSGDITISNAGVTTIGAATVANTMLENITRGSVKVGGAANAPTDLAAKADGQILIGDDTDINSVAVTGDVIIDNAGLTAIGTDKVLNTMLANITRGSVKVGGESDAPTDLAAKADGQILIGDGTDIASVAMSGDVTILNTGETAIVAGKVDITETAAALLKGITTLNMSFETGEVSETKIYFPFAVEIEKIRSIVMKAIEASNDGTITGANSAGTSNNGIVTVAGASAVNVEDSADPDTNVAVAANSWYKLTTAKTNAGGKVLVTLEYKRTA